MNMNKLLFKDSKGNKSVTMTAFVWGSLVINAKLILSGMTIEGITLSQFSGGDYAAAMGALGAVYVLRRHPTIDKPEKTKAEKSENPG